MPVPGRRPPRRRAACAHPGGPNGRRQCSPPYWETRQSGRQTVFRSLGDTMQLRAGVAIDLGTVNTLVWIRGRGLVVEEPSAIAVDTVIGKAIATGEAAELMAGKEPRDVEVIHPLRDGVITDLNAATAMLQAFFGRARLRRGLLRPSAVVCVPSGATLVERQALAMAVQTRRPRCSVRIVEEPAAAAAGAGLGSVRRRGCLRRRCRRRHDRDRGGDQRPPRTSRFAAAGRQRHGRGDRAGGEDRARPADRPEGGQAPEDCARAHRRNGRTRGDGRRRYQARGRPGWRWSRAPWSPTHSSRPWPRSLTRYGRCC